MLYVLIAIINILFSVSYLQASLGAMVVGGGGSNLLDLSTLPETIVKRLSAVEALQVRFTRNSTMSPASRVPQLQTKLQNNSAARHPILLLLLSSLHSCLRL